jgi:hypothetical protein
LAENIRKTISDVLARQKYINMIDGSGFVIGDVFE